MPKTEQNRVSEFNGEERQFRSFYLVAAYCAVVVIAGSILDIIIGTALGGDLTSLPQSAIGRFIQFNENQWIGLYSLDLLNVVTTLILIPVFLSLFLAHRNVNYPVALLSLIIFCIGTAVFVCNNSALVMLELSKKYAGAAEPERILIAAAGETMLVKGAHGSPAVFIGFLLPILADIIIAFVMIGGRIFSRTAGYLGIVGNISLLSYLILVTFSPEMKSAAMVIAAPGGIMVIIWMILFTKKLFQLGKQNPV